MDKEAIRSMTRNEWKAYHRQCRIEKSTNPHYRENHNPRSGDLTVIITEHDGFGNEMIHVEGPFHVNSEAAARRDYAKTVRLPIYDNEWV